MAAKANSLMNQKTNSYALSEIDTVANSLYALKDHCKVYTFSGPLGAGKTTLIKSLLQSFDVHVPITSPTFSYFNVYENNKGELLYHFDLYRLADLNEFLQAGFNEFLFLQKSWAFIEWPDIIAPLLTRATCFVTLEYAPGQQERKLIYSMI